MALEMIWLANAVVLLLSIVLVTFAASVVHRFNRHFSEGEVKELGHNVLLAMLALLIKLLIDFSIIVLPSFAENAQSMVQILGIFGIAFMILTAVFLIRVAMLIKQLSKQFGFEVK